jgi:hypothetical protein
MNILYLLCVVFLLYVFLFCIIIIKNPYFILSTQFETSCKFKIYMYFILILNIVY